MLIFFKNIHLICAILFALYIAIDRLYIRKFVHKNSRERFYSKSKYPMLILSLFLLISGGVLLSQFSFSWLLLAKVLSALLLLFGFFYCPKFMKKDVSKFKQMFYRFGVVALLALTLHLGVLL